MYFSNVKVFFEVSEDGILEVNYIFIFVCFGSFFIVIVIIFDDDYVGIFIFEEFVIYVSESIGIMEVKVLRIFGVRGNVIVFYKIIEGIVRGGGEDFEDICGELEF